MLGARAWENRGKDPAMLLAGTECDANARTRRRVLLSGTPMQNDLEEFFSMVDFTNPGLYSRMCCIVLLSLAICAVYVLRRTLRTLPRAPGDFGERRALHAGFSV